MLVPSLRPEEVPQFAAAPSNADLEALAAPTLEARPSAVVAVLAQLGLQVALGTANALAPVPTSPAQMAAPDALPPALVAVLARLGHKVEPATALVEVDEVAAVLGVTRWSVYRWAAQGRIPCVRAGRKVRFEIERVIAALRSEGPRAEAPQAAASARLTAPPRATRTARSREAPKRRAVTGGLPRALLPRRAQAVASAQQERASARQEPVDEIARRRAVVETTRALKE